MKVLILGASGIVAQHMRLCAPQSVETVWVRHHADPITSGIDLESATQLRAILEGTKPDVVVNLAGESGVDVVDQDPLRYRRINIDVPRELADWCFANGARFIQVSSQAVFRGDYPPYVDHDEQCPVNHYGRQKSSAEVRASIADGVIVRLSFILGIRPLPHVGRMNPMESMMAGQSPQVDNRHFSPLWAWDAAELMWDAVLTAHPGEVRHCGIAQRWSRYDIAKLVNPAVRPCKHEDFHGLALRPLDTTYSNSLYIRDIRTGLDYMNLQAASDRATELALFFGMRLDAATEKLAQGFGPLHNAVTDDFRATFQSREETPDEAKLLDWYRKTEAYIWELSAYHEDAGFNYGGMCEGIATRLKSAGHDGRPGVLNTSAVLCLGDGIGDLTLTMHRAGFNAHYHDLAGSRTAEYAQYRFWRQTGSALNVNYHMTNDFKPVGSKSRWTDTGFDAIVSLDFLEHVTDVAAWVEAIYAALNPGGLFCAQNAFACGSGPDGAMPMHLAGNDMYETEWDPMLRRIGFIQDSSNWYIKPLMAMASGGIVPKPAIPYLVGE